jgi:hypothetical protein
MKKRYSFSVMLACLLALGLAFLSCDIDIDPVVVNPETVTYTSTAGGVTYRLAVVQNVIRAAYNPQMGDIYVFEIVEGTNTKHSNGQIANVSVAGANTILNLSNGTNLSVTISNNRMIRVDGTINISGSEPHDASGPVNPQGAGGDQNGGDELPALTGTVTISNASPIVGNTLTATYSGNGTGTATWRWLRNEIVIANSNSNIYLVSPEDEGASLRVRVSFANQEGTVTSEATAQIVAAEGNPTVTSVTVSAQGGVTSVTRGGSLQFSATVIGTGNPGQSVAWSIVEAWKHANTTISTGGLLNVAPAEPLNSLTIRATSTVNTAISGTATLTVNSGGGTTPPLQNLTLFIIRADSSDLGFAFRVVSGDFNVDEYRVSHSGTKIGSDTAMFHGFDGVSVPKGTVLSADGLTVISAQAFEGANATSLANTLPAMVKYPTNYQHRVQDWLEFLQIGLIAKQFATGSLLSAENGALLENIQDTLRDNEGNWSEGLAEALTHNPSFTSASLNDATGDVLQEYEKIMTWLKGGWKTTHGHLFTEEEMTDALNTIKETSVRLWFNMVFNGTNDGMINNIIKAEIMEKHPAVTSIQ